MTLKNLATLSFLIILIAGSVWAGNQISQKSNLLPQAKETQLRTACIYTFSISSKSSSPSARSSNSGNSLESKSILQQLIIWYENLKSNY